MSSIALTKQAAAARLILGAVEMMRQGIDLIATHVVACSALNLLRELVASRGSTYVTAVFQTAFYDAAKAKVAGRQHTLPQHAEIDRIVEGLADAIQLGDLTNANAINIDLPKKMERELLDFLIAPFNFLKHADRDSTNVLYEDEVSPTEAIMHAIAAFCTLFPTQPLPDEVASFLRENKVIE